MDYRAKHKAAENEEGANLGEEAGELVRFGVSMPSQLARDLDVWRKERGYASRSEAVRDMVRDALVAAQWQNEQTPSNRETVGIVTLVYRHSHYQVGDHLTQIQHHHHATTQAALHIHLSEENCLEVVVLRGPQAEVQALAEHLISARGVLHGKFVPTTTGEEIT